MRIVLRVWRQGREERKGRLVDYEVPDVSPDMSFLEMLDVLNDSLERRGEEPIAFEHDCREGICGSCGFMIDGRAHGPLPGTTVCQLHMRHFADGDTLVVEPWRARAFPVIKDLVVDRGAFDRIIQAGGYISVNTGSAPEANAVPVAKDEAEAALDAAALHRLRRVRGRLQERVGHAVHQRQAHPPGTAPAGTAGAPPPRPHHGAHHGRGGVRQLHERGGVRSGVPEGNLFRHHRAPQPRVPGRRALRPRRGVIP